MYNYNILTEICNFLKNNSLSANSYAIYQIKFNIKKILQKSENEIYFIKMMVTLRINYIIMYL